MNTPPSPPCSLPPTGGRLLRETLLVGVYNSAIALFLTLLTPIAFGINMLYSHCIGFAIFGFVRGSCGLWRQPRPGLLNAVLGIPLGFITGFPLATWLSGNTLTAVIEAHPQVVLIAGATALLFGAVAIWYFRGEVGLQAAQAEARAERLRRAEQESLATHAELARLQAQIEPHFLFNTLSNIVGLIDTDPAAARTMLLDLTELLRTSLARTRRRDVRLSEELGLLRAYLGIMAARMGSRLVWHIEADDDVLRARLPPLLVQPLVENAIHHGLDPLPAGGSLVIRCRRDGPTLAISVADDGRGLAGDARKGNSFRDAGGGTGLTNVRERLRGCYGDAASLAVETNPGGGVTARLRLPLDAS